MRKIEVCVILGNLGEDYTKTLAKISGRNYQIVKRTGKNIVVHVKRLKKAYKQNELKPRPNHKTNHRKGKAKEGTE
jgi:hypothetical protein